MPRRYKKKSRKDKFPFWYAIDFDLTTGQTQQSSITISADADFYCTKLMCSSTDIFTTKITNTGSGREHQNIAINGQSFFGKGWQTQESASEIGIAMSHQGAFVLESPMKFKKNSDIGVTCTDTSSASNTVQLVFFGYKIY